METELTKLSAELRANAEAIARHLLPAGKLRQREWVCTGSQSPTGGAISVYVGSGPKRGICGFWGEADGRSGGDILDLIQRVNGGSVIEAAEFGRRWLGIADRKAVFSRPAAKEREDRTEAKFEAERYNRASGIWKRTAPLSGAPAAYLRSRGLDPTLAGDRIRSFFGLPYPDGRSFPALVAKVTDVSDKGLGIWRIYTKSDGSGKAPVESPKMGLGNVRGGSVRVGGIGETIGVCEGIETAIACRQIIRRVANPIPVWAALSAAGLQNVEIPDTVQHVRIFADADALKFPRGQIKESVGISAAKALAERLDKQGIQISIEAPPTGMDWLSLLNEIDKYENETK